MSPIAIELVKSFIKVENIYSNEETRNQINFGELITLRNFIQDQGINIDEVSDYIVANNVK
tara:strand:- start:1236 stop:1418 length:183 start_codon:yes stop_codon:yes gene_type:complete